METNKFLYLINFLLATSLILWNFLCQIILHIIPCISLTYTMISGEMIQLYYTRVYPFRVHFIAVNISVCNSCKGKHRPLMAPYDIVSNMRNSVHLFHISLLDNKVDLEMYSNHVVFHVCMLLGHHSFLALPALISCGFSGIKGISLARTYRLAVCQLWS